MLHTIGQFLQSLKKTHNSAVCLLGYNTFKTLAFLEKTKKLGCMQ